MEQREYLRLFLTCSREQRNFLITSASRDQLKALEEIAHNVLRSIILLTEEQKLTLRRRVSVIRLLGDPTISYRGRKHVDQSEIGTFEISRGLSTYKR